MCPIPTRELAQRRILALCRKLALLEVTSEIAIASYQIAVEERLFNQQPLRHIVAACVFEGCRRSLAYITWNEFTRVDVVELTKTHKSLSCGLEGLGPARLGGLICEGPRQLSVICGPQIQFVETVHLSMYLAFCTSWPRLTCVCDPPHLCMVTSRKSPRARFVLDRPSSSQVNNQLPQRLRV